MYPRLTQWGGKMRVNEWKWLKNEIQRLKRRTIPFLIELNSHLRLVGHNWHFRFAYLFFSLPSSNLIQCTFNSHLMFIFSFISICMHHQNENEPTMDDFRNLLTSPTTTMRQLFLLVWIFGHVTWREKKTCSIDESSCWWSMSRLIETSREQGVTRGMRWVVCDTLFCLPSSYEFWFFLMAVFWSCFVMSTSLVCFLSVWTVTSPHLFPLFSPFPIETCLFVSSFLCCVWVVMLITFISLTRWSPSSSSGCNDWERKRIGESLS